MSDKELEALARKLCALYIDAIGVKNPVSFDELDPITHDAWIQVARYIMNEYGISSTDIILSQMSNDPDHR